MGAVLVVENDIAWLDTLKKVMRDAYSDNSEVRGIHPGSDVIAALSQEGCLDDVDLALVDLELGAAVDSAPGDFDGRDLVLSHIRQRASWIPVVLVSRFISSGDARILAQTTPYGFDAIVEKKFFSTPTVNRRQWEELRHSVAISRVAGLTGRSVAEINECLQGELRCEYGLGVKQQLEWLPPERLSTLLKLCGFSGRIVLDEVVLGYSGLAVLSAKAIGPGGVVQWLLKFGASTKKIADEVSAHRRMFLDGSTRRVSVPVYWWRPIVWESVGLIAYEFEEDSRTLLAFARSQGLPALRATLDAIAPALSILYAGSHSEPVVPRSCVTNLSKQGDKLIDFGVRDEVVTAVLENRPLEEIDRSASVLVGRQHGDLHARNILLGPRGPVLIDFAHFISAEQKGVPLVDLAKLLVDLAIWGVTSWEMSELTSASVLSRPELARIAALCFQGERPTDDEIRMFSIACKCILAQYLLYPDVPRESKERAAAALGVGT